MRQLPDPWKESNKFELKLIMTKKTGNRRNKIQRPLGPFSKSSQNDRSQNWANAASPRRHRDPESQVRQKVELFTYLLMLERVPLELLSLLQCYEWEREEEDRKVELSELLRKRREESEI